MFISYYWKDVFDKLDPSKYLTVDLQLISYLSKTNIPLCVVTLGSKKYSDILQSSLGITSFFKTFFAIDYLPSYEKVEIYKQICGDQGVDYSDALIVGDSYNIDLKVANEEGFQCVLISDKFDYDIETYSDIYSFFENLLENKK